ncbi:GNAT family N-acetyltransferase [Leifsonia shinshuensis]|uniref:GNAT family N-acetyltransferase n=1 Tax=Leifsonia shinshuensis TaxID=150026 RepID=UPI0028663D96|nr:GNAT family N-acetyltransferase [Leifsonia shinshuensis]MDR6970791.1 GNAT superfamily N-acetyltransferase [Leifsonia shinshuensis]
MDARIAGPGDVDAVAETIALAFRDDPVWGPALEAADGGTGHLYPFWRFFAEGGIPHGHVWLVDGPRGEAATVALWIPPGADELTEEQEQAADALMQRILTPERFDAYRRLWTLFEQSHPHDTPHMYLSLLATHPEHRGQGVGQRLLAETLARFDADGVPSYLESTNPANDHRYERAGFRPVGGFRAVLGGAAVTTMWRDARGPVA